MLIRYARVSTRGQNLNTQKEQLQEAGCTLLFEDVISGASRKRPQLNRMLDQLRESDTVIVTRLDRMARSTSDLLTVIEIFREKSCGFRSLAEPWADTTSHAGKMVMTIFSGIAEFERNLIKERTSRGREYAMARGVRFGRPTKLSKEQKKLALYLIEQGKSVTEIAKTFNVNRSTIYRINGNDNQ